MSRLLLGLVAVALTGAAHASPLPECDPHSLLPTPKYCSCANEVSFQPRLAYRRAVSVRYEVGDRVRNGEWRFWQAANWRFRHLARPHSGHEWLVHDGEFLQVATADGAIDATVRAH
jgi:Nickel/cobalt transporter regulator